VAIFNDLRQGVQDIEFLSDPTTGEIRIGSTDPVSVALVSPCRPPGVYQTRKHGSGRPLSRPTAPSRS
jgi:hypothetical protein